MLDAPSARIIIIRIDIIVMIDIIWQQDVSQVNCLLVMNNIQQSTTEERGWWQPRRQQVYGEFW